MLRVFSTDTNGLLDVRDNNKQLRHRDFLACGDTLRGVLKLLSQGLFNPVSFLPVWNIIVPEANHLPQMVVSIVLVMA